MDDSIRIRDLGYESLRDKDGLLSFYNENFSHSQWDMKKLDSFFDEKNKGVCFIVEADGRMGGFLMAKTSKNDEKCINLSALFVDDELRGKGFAKKMVELLIEKIFQDSDINKIELHFREPKNLQVFYEKLGFDNCGVVGAYKNGELKYRMEMSKSDSYC